MSEGGEWDVLGGGADAALSGPLSSTRKLLASSQPLQHHPSPWSNTLGYSHSYPTTAIIDAALRSVIENIEPAQCQSSKISINTFGTPAYCIDQLYNHVFPEWAKREFLNKRYSPAKLYNHSPLKDLLQEHYKEDSWNNFWKGVRMRYSTNLGSSTDFQHPVGNITNSNQAYAEKIIALINHRADTTDSKVDTIAQNNTPIKACSLDGKAGGKIVRNYFKSKFEEVQEQIRDKNANADSIKNFFYWTEILKKKNDSAIDESYPKNVFVIRHPSSTQLFADECTTFLSQKQVLIFEEDGQDTIVFNSSEFASNKVFSKGILGALSFTCSSTVFVLTKDNDGEILRHELSIRGKTTKSICHTADILYDSICELKQSEIVCVGIINPEHFYTLFNELNLKEKYEQQRLIDRFQIEGIKSHLEDTEHVPFPPGITKCSNPSVILDEHITLLVVDNEGPISLLNQKVLILGDGCIFAYTDAISYPDYHDALVERFGRIFAMPMGILVEVDQRDGVDDICISFQIMAADGLGAFRSLTCISNCLASAAPDIIKGVALETLDNSICPLPLTIDSFKSLLWLQRPVELYRFAITVDLQEAMVYSTSPITFVDCPFESGGETLFKSSLRFTDAFKTPMQIVFKLDREDLQISLPPYKLLKSAIEKGRIASLTLCGNAMFIKSNNDIEGIREILNLGFVYEVDSRIFIKHIGNTDVMLNLVFCGIGRDLIIDGCPIHDVNTIGCKDQTDEGGNKSIVIKLFLAGTLSAEKAFTFATKKDNAPTKLEHSTEDNIADRTFVNTNIDAEQKTCIKCTSPSSTKDAVCTVWDRSGQQDGQKLAAKLETNSVNKVELYNLPNEFSPELTECCIIGSKTKVEPVTHENIDFIPRFKVGDWIMYRERKMILVRMDKTHQNDQKEQFWMVKSENSERLSRIKAKNMTLIVV